MPEIQNTYSSLKIFECNRLIVNNGPDEIFNFQVVLDTRILIFERAGGHLIIDFMEHHIEPDYIYIVPPLHHYHLNCNNTGNFICIDINNFLLKPRDKKLLYAIKYSKYKSLPPLDGADDACSYKNALALTQDTCDDQRLISTVQHWIGSRISTNLIASPQKWNDKHVEIADRFLGLLATKQLTLVSRKISTLALEMFCSERTLHRVCIGSFGICAKEVSNYHFKLKAISLLTNYHLSFKDIATELEFSSITSFNHFIKNATCFTPSYIREELRKAGL